MARSEHLPIYKASYDLCLYFELRPGTSLATDNDQAAAAGNDRRDGTVRGASMIRSFILAALFGVASYAIPAAAVDADSITHCKSISLIARTAMQKRQAGSSMSDLVDTQASLDGDSDMTKDVKAMAIHFIRLAFKQPRWPGEEMQQREISEFESAVFADCLDERDKLTEKAE